MQNLKLVVIQADIIWEDVDQNLDNFENKLSQIVERPDLIVLPEMFNTGFTMNVEKCAEKENGKTVNWVQQRAQEKDCVITGSLLVNEAGKFYNRMFWVNPDGSYETYDKRHLFRMGFEHHTMSQGLNKKIVKLFDWRINLQICYDLRFPELFRTYALKGVKLVLLPAAFPYPRLAHWKILTRARAIENQFFIVGANQVGDENFEAEDTVTYFGNSCVIDPWGETLIEASENREELLNVEIDLDRVDEVRSCMMILKDRRPDLYELG